ncbi:MAG TPA: hypothetical protein VGA38_00275 [Candidatus Limnocylindria bacterium]
MPKRQRRSTRERRAATAGARPAAHDRAVGAPTSTRRSYSGSQRAGSTVRPGVARAAGDASPVLEREASQERAYVVKDFRRIGIVVAIMLALLVVSDVAVNALLP